MKALNILVQFENLEQIEKSPGEKKNTVVKIYKYSLLGEQCP